MASTSSAFGKFDPSEDPGNVLKNFLDFVSAYAYEYEAITKAPPEGVDEVEWHAINKRRQFLGKYASRTFQRDFEDAVSPERRSTLTFDEMVAAMTVRYQPTKNTTLIHYEFHQLRQEPGERFDTFVNRVKRHAENCEFVCLHENCQVRETLIRDQLVIGTTNNEIRRNALKEQWGLAELTTRARQLEAASYGAKQITDEIRGGFVNKVGGRYSKKTRMQQATEKKPDKQSCPNCSRKNCAGGRKCYAHDRKCFACGDTGHLRGATACSSSKEETSKKKKSSSRRIQQDSSESSESESADEEVSVNRLSRTRAQKAVHIAHVRRVARARRSKSGMAASRYNVEVIVKEQPIRAFADTGADISVMSAKTAEDLQLDLHKSKVVLRPYGSKSIKCKKAYLGTVMYGSNVANILFHIVPREVETLLSGAAAEALGILSMHPEADPADVRKVEVPKSVHQLLNRFPQCLKGVGKLKNYQVKFDIDESVRPAAHPPRPVPFHLKSQLRKELDKMLHDGIIEEHHGPAPWVSNVVLSPKEDGLRVTVDMRKPNEAIRDVNIPIPRVEEIRSQLAGFTHFSKLDLKSAFHQLELAPESRILTVFNDGDRLLRYTRLTMGTKPASGELNKALRPLFREHEFAHVIHDDLVIATNGEDEHYAALEKVLETLAENGLTLNVDKCHFNKSEIPFWGMRVSAQGVSPDPSRVEALRDAAPPQSKKEVMSFLCMVQSFSEFIPNLSRKTSHLRALTKKNVHFAWSKECQQEFADLRTALTDKVTLSHFDVEKPVTIFVDAHRSGLSAILAQGTDGGGNQVVACASRATTPVERRYPQIDLESMAIDFALRRYRQFLVGGPKATVITDHKPLVSIFASTRKGSIRTERIQLRHQDVPYKVEWRAGHNNPADFLSRHATPVEKLPGDWVEESSELEKTIWLLHYSPYVESVSMDKLITATKEDRQLTALKSALSRGFIPSELKEDLKAFKSILEELTISEEGLLLKKDKIVLPEALYEVAMRKAHQGSHPGVSSMKRRIRSHFWFPGMDSAIESWVAKCKPCQLFTGKTTKEPMNVLPLPKDVWDTVNIDLFGPMPNKKHILVVQDHLSRFPAAEIVTSTAAKPVLKALDHVYEAYGNPVKHRTDNGPPFNSREFKDFSDSKGIEHIKVFEYHPQANSAETFMKTVGKNMKVAALEGENQEKALAELLKDYRETPHRATGQTPGNVMFRGGYSSGFPRQSLSDLEVQQARTKDLRKKLDRAEQINSSSRRVHDPIEEGDLVLLKAMKRRKFDPVFDDEAWRVIDVQGKGLVVQRDGQVKRRHKDDVKLMKHSSNEDMASETGPLHLDV